VVKCNEAEDWLYEDGSDVGFKEYQTKSYELTGPFNRFKNRKAEHEARTKLTDEMTETLTQMRDKLPDILAKKPWISEEEGSDVASKITETLTWLEDKMTA
jgi:hypothetical protein